MGLSPILGNLIKKQKEIHIENGIFYNKNKYITILSNMCHNNDNYWGQQCENMKVYLGNINWVEGINTYCKKDSLCKTSLTDHCKNKNNNDYSELNNCFKEQLKFDEGIKKHCKNDYRCQAFLTDHCKNNKEYTDSETCFSEKYQKLYKEQLKEQLKFDEGIKKHCK